VAKLPNPPGVEELRRVEPEIMMLPVGVFLFRIYFRGGDYPGGWKEFRSFGPLASARFDQHPEPRQLHESFGILYGASRIKTCVAEVFQEKRTVNTREREPWLVGFSLSERLPLLNLTGDWPTRAGASMSIHSGPRPKSRRWSRTIYTAYPEVVGLLYASSMHANQPAVAFYERATGAITPNPEIHVPLSHPGLAGGLEEMAKELGYDFT
jgi:hypothetical protein